MHLVRRWRAIRLRIGLARGPRLRSNHPSEAEMTLKLDRLASLFVCGIAGFAMTGVGCGGKSVQGYNDASVTFDGHGGTSGSGGTPRSAGSPPAPRAQPPPAPRAVLLPRRGGPRSQVGGGGGR